MEEKDIKKQQIEEAILYKKMQKDPFLFIKIMWNLVPQKGTPEEDNLETYVRGKHISWQQVQMIQAMKDAVNGKKSRKISIKSWRWVGKTAYLSWAVLWFLYCYPEAIVTCTWPSAKQLQDGIWKEISVWLEKMPPSIRVKFEKTSEYIRIVDDPAKRYARVITGTKENAENVSGVHADNTLSIIDEASWVENEIMDSIKGTMTWKNALLVMIWNPKRLDWYFYDSHNKLSDTFQTFTFSGEDSPNVDKQYVEDQIREYGMDSDEYRFNVKWEFPKQEGVDDGWWIPLLQQSDLNLTSNAEFEPFRLGIDPAWLGRDESKFVGRDTFKARVLSSEKLSDAKSVAGIALTLWTHYSIMSEQMYVDNFGVGANISQEMALAGQRVNWVNVGNKARDSKRFKNIRAEAYRGLREWIKRWWQLVNNWAREDELLKIKYKRGLDGRIQIMPKEEMKKRMWKSPDSADALMLTFIDDDDIWYRQEVIEVDYSDML